MKRPGAVDVLRVAAAMCFIGHGAFGILTKEAWLAYFAVAGIGREGGYALMPVVGAVDILLGVSMLWPTRGALAYMTAWAAWTALLRPLAGQGVLECLERAGNYGVPAALLLLSGGARGSWLGRLPGIPSGPVAVARAAWVLRLTTATLLLGHGGLALSGKAMLVKHLAIFGLGAQAVAAQGAFEVALAVGVLVSPSLPLLLLAVSWKIATELLFPLTGDSFWEFVERGGSYGAPLALALLARHLENRPGLRPRLEPALGT